MHISIRPFAVPFAEAGSVEIVERKGLGHPDSLCDALAEEFSLTLSRFYRDRFGFILHHNVDKVLLHGGQARAAFGGGELLQPIEIFLSGRATHEYGGVNVPVEEIAIEGSRHWLRRHLRALDPERHVVIHPLVRPGSRDLVELYLRAAKEGRWLANDTSCGVGYAPLSGLEGVVMTTERRLNERAVKETHPWIGEDVKVLGVRRGPQIDLTVGCAFVDRKVRDIGDYVTKKNEVATFAREVASCAAASEVALRVNTADDVERGSVYITVTGTSAEAGDDGQAGRGNRANGLITPYRPMTMESVAGKNPTTHVGKLYNLAAGLMAERIVEGRPDVAAAEVYLLSRIGEPVAEPTVVDVRLAPREGRAVRDLAPDVEAMVRGELAQIGRLWERLLSGELRFDRWPMGHGYAADRRVSTSR